MKFIIPNSASAFLAQQRTKKDVGDAEREAQILCEMVDLPSWLTRPPERILEIGCGVGIGLCALGSMFPDATLVGIDGDGPPSPRGGWFQHNEMAWNQLDVTRELLDANKVAAKVYSINEGKNLSAQFDLVVSTCALGWHWPIEQESALLDRCGVDLLYLDMRKGYQHVPNGWALIHTKSINPKRDRVLLERRL